MGHDQDLLEVRGYGVYRLDQPVAAGRVLGAEPLVDDQELELRAGPAREQLRERDADREVDPERLAARVHLVVARAELVRDLDVERLDHALARLRLALGL